jgi:hypothetical protein
MRETTTLLESVSTSSMPQLKRGQDDEPRTAPTPEERAAADAWYAKRFAELEESEGTIRPEGPLRLRERLVTLVEEITVGLDADDTEAAADALRAMQELADEAEERARIGESRAAVYADELVALGRQLGSSDHGRVEGAGARPQGLGYLDHPEGETGLLARMGI